VRARLVGHADLMMSLPGRAAIAAIAAAMVIVAGTCAACSHAPSDDSPPTRSQLAAFLAGQSRAVSGHDRAGVVAGLDPRASAARFRDRQLAAYDNLTRLPLASWRYLLGPRAQAPGAQRQARHRFGPSAVVYQVTLRYALRGMDRLPSSHLLWWTFARVAGRIVVSSDSALDLVGGVSWRGPWDFGPLHVVRGRHCLVLGHGAGSLPGLRQLAADVDRAVPAVSAVWGDDWSRDVLVVVPQGPAERSADLGTAEEEAAPVAAVATSDGTDPLTGTPLGQRLVVDPRQVRRLSPLGLQILLRHEVTHIASAAATTDASPTWLVEGFAEYVANLHTGQPVPVAAQELAAAVRRGAVPRGLPGSGAFAAAHAAVVYESSWLACRMFAQRFGQAALVRFYRQVGRAPGPPAAAVAAAMRSVAHEPTARFVSQWRAYVTALLRPGGHG